MVIDSFFLNFLFLKFISSLMDLFENACAGNIVSINYLKTLVESPCSINSRIISLVISYFSRLPEEFFKITDFSNVDRNLLTPLTNIERHYIGEHSLKFLVAISSGNSFSLNRVVKEYFVYEKVKTYAFDASFILEYYYMIDKNLDDEVFLGLMLLLKHYKFDTLSEHSIFYLLKNIYLPGYEVCLRKKIVCNLKFGSRRQIFRQLYLLGKYVEVDKDILEVFNSGHKIYAAYLFFVSLYKKCYTPTQMINLISCLNMQPAKVLALLGELLHQADKDIFNFDDMLRHIFAEDQDVYPGTKVYVSAAVAYYMTEGLTKKEAIDEIIKKWKF